ncbi:MAG TPA: hypothetical protein VF468_26255 [Actinomycetota bacterium]|nr:hypothetical protein [Actinomycetota bacterium]
MRWFLALVVGVVAVLAGAGPVRAADPGPVAPPSALVLVERLTLDEALAVTGADRPEVAGFVSTLPVHQPVASRVLSLAAGRRVDALAALGDDPDASGLPGPDAVARIRADNPGARLGRLPPTTRVLAWPGQEAAGLFTLGPDGPATPPGPLAGDGPLPLEPGRLLVLAVPDAAALADVLDRLEPAGDAPRSVMVVGLRAAPGRANAAPLLVLDPRLPGGLPTSGSTRRVGLAALEDVRPTLAGGASAGDDGSVIQVVADGAAPADATRLDRRVAALVAARTWAIPLLCLAAVLALFALVAVWRGRGPPGRAASAGRVMLALTLALPSGYLVASMAEPLAARLWAAVLPGPNGPGTGIWAVAWVASGIAVAAALAAVALRLDRPAGGDGPRRPRRVPAPALLGAGLCVLVTLDLVLGGQGLSQPLVGGSAWDGERFYGLGNGYFAFALAAVMLIAAFAPLSAVATAGLLAALGVVDGLPRLGADVGGALTSMLTAAAALVVLAPGRPRARRVVLLAGLAVAAAVAVALGAGLGGPVSHAGRFAERLQQGPADAAGVVVDQLARNLRLLANSPFAWVGPLEVLLAGLIALRPPGPLRQLPGWTRRVLGLGAFGSLLLILLNDTGVTATAGSGLFLLAIPAWAWLEGQRPAGPPAPAPSARPAEARH